MITSISPARATEPRVIALALEYVRILDLKDKATPRERARLTEILVTEDIAEGDLIEIAQNQDHKKSIHKSIKYNSISGPIRFF